MAVAVLALPLFVHAIIPQSVDGAFSLAHSAHAQTDSEGGVLHDPTIDLLEAATHPDPNPNKSDALKLYSVYAPPHHKDAVVHPTKHDAHADTEHFDGQTTDDLA